VDAKERRQKPKQEKPWGWMSSEWDSDSPSPHERTLKSSTSKIPTERENRPIQSGQTDHLRLQVAVKRGTLLRIKKQGYRITGTKKNVCRMYLPPTTNHTNKRTWILVLQYLIHFLAKSLI
jgi:hypothetical protein